MGQWKNKSCTKNLPLHDEAWKKKITIAHLMLKGYTQEEAQHKADVWYNSCEQ
jgi:hypothetical protein